MDLFCIGISHKTAPVEIREILAFTQEEKIDFIQSAIRQEGIHECVLITTCNRTEAYVAGEENLTEQVMRLFAEKKHFKMDKMKKYFLRYNNKKAVKHLFSVAAGLDSMVIGEDEILGQVKDHYQLALQTGTTDFLLNTLFRYAITSAKKVKTDTRLSKTPVSIGTLAANEVFRFNGKDQRKKVLIIGLSGKMGTIIMKNLYHNKMIEITGTSRNHIINEQVNLLYPGVNIIDYQKRYDKINEADIVISATSSPHFTVTSEELKEFITEKKQRLFIDLAVPTDIDKAVGQLPFTSLIDIDYFKKLSEENNNIKLIEAETAKLIIDKQVDEFYKEVNFREFLPHMKEIGDLFQSKPFETILYQIRNNVSSEELEIILYNFLKLKEN